MPSNYKPEGLWIVNTPRLIIFTSIFQLRVATLLCVLVISYLITLFGFWKIKICTISLVPNLSTSQWSQREYWCQQDLDKNQYSEKEELKSSNWIFRNSNLTRTCEMSNIPSRFQFSSLKWHFKCNSTFHECRLCVYLSDHFQTRLLNAIINSSFLYYAIYHRFSECMFPFCSIIWTVQLPRNNLS